MIKTYTYKIKTNKAFERKFDYWVGALRFVYNCALECKITAYRRAGVTLSKFDLQKQLSEARNENDWLKEVGVVTLRAGLEKLDNAYKGFFRERKGFPKFASKKKWKSIQFPTQAVSYKDGRFYLTKWGYIKVFKDYIPDGGIKTASIVKKADGYYLHVQAECEYQNLNENQVGIDMGISEFCVCSDGKVVHNPRILKQYERKLRVENRSLSRKKKFSKRWYKQVNRLAKLHLKIKRVREDFSHKQSTEIAKNYGTVFMENLNIKGMVRSNLSKHIIDCSWGSFKRKLLYKANVITISPKYTSQTCSNCGHCEKENRITQSEFKCKSCGTELNADYNASLNILGKGIAVIREREGSNSCALDEKPKRIIVCQQQLN